jgi:hypothetical protein
VLVVVIWTACSNEDYCSPILCLGVKQRTSSSVAFYDMPRKDSDVCIFIVPVHTRGVAREKIISRSYTPNLVLYNGSILKY